MTLSIPHNTIMDLNNVMTSLPTWCVYNKHMCGGIAIGECHLSMFHPL